MPRTTTTPTDEQASHAAVARLRDRLRAERPGIVLTVTDAHGEPAHVRCRDVREALASALPTCTVRVGRDWWTGRDQTITLSAYLAAFEQHAQDLTMRVRALEAGRVAVEQIQTVERDKDGRITRTRTVDVPATPRDV